MTKKDKVTVNDIIGIVHTDETTNSVEEVKKLRGRNERFIVDDAGTLIDIETRNNYDYVSELLPLLNDLTNEIKIARTVIQMKRQQIDSLKTENEQLKKDCTVLIYHNQEYRKENEQLKSTIKEVTELLSEEVDLFSDKATEHDINAYVELKELDNKDAYYMATATKKAIRMLKELQE